MIMNPVAVVNSNKCDSTELAVNMALFCRIDRPTSFCCDIIMSSVQHCGGLNMICLASESPVIISSGYTPQNVIIWYVQCGGELPTSHTSTNTIDHSSLCYPGTFLFPTSSVWGCIKFLSFFFGHFPNLYSLMFVLIEYARCCWSSFACKT